MGKYILIERILLIPSLNAHTRLCYFSTILPHPKDTPKTQIFMSFDLILTTFTSPIQNPTQV
jgi:hypothetical protein